jgi:hypothetical protein
VDSASLSAVVGTLAEEAMSSSMLWGFGCAGADAGEKGGFGLERCVSGGLVSSCRWR